jgi:hypothetical protein
MVRWRRNVYMEVFIGRFGGIGQRQRVDGSAG